MSTVPDSVRPFVAMVENVAVYGLLIGVAMNPSLVAVGAFGVALAAPALFAIRRTD